LFFVAFGMPGFGLIFALVDRFLNLYDVFGKFGEALLFFFGFLAVFLCFGLFYRAFGALFEGV
jgi:hypothetical protein